MIIRYLLLLLFICLIYSSVFAQFTVISSITNVTCPAGNDGRVSASVSGGTTPYTYLWSTSPAQLSSSATGLSAGNYSLTITDNTGADTTIVITISQPSAILDNSAIHQPICIKNGSIALNPTGGTPSYQILWNTGQTNFSITGLDAGSYSVIITDAKNCTANFSYSLSQTECTVSPHSYFTPNGDGYNDTWAIGNSHYFREAHLIVFDRWGTRVFEHRGLYEPWDGKSYLGIPVPDAVYYYFFYPDKNTSQKEARNGSVTILR